MDKPIELLNTQQAQRLAAQPCVGCDANEFVQVVEQAPMAISITDLKANILYVNPAFSQITGYHREELVGSNHSLLSYRTTPTEIYQALWNKITKGQCWQGRLINRRKSGERYLADVTVSPIRDEQGKVTHYMGLHQDVTDSHAISTRLANQQSLTNAVLDAAPVAIALLNRSFNPVLGNRAYQQLKEDFGNEPAEIILGKLIDDLGHDAVDKLTSRRYSEGRSVALDLQQRGERWFYCRLSTLKVADADVDGYFSPTESAYLVLTVGEHTRERRQQEQQRVAELQRITAEAETLHAMQETLHAAIHQMQGPMNMVNAAVGMLSQRSEKCMGLEGLEMALSSGTEVLEQLQTALPERAREAVQPVNLNQIIHDVTAMATQRLLRLSISMQLQLTATLPSITGQPQRLRVAIKQLIDNAIDAIEYARCDERLILIRTVESEDGVRLEIEDSGPGVPERQRLAIFKPFHSTKPGHIEGYRGIGLSIVQQVVNEHTGTVVFRESVIGGANVTLHLPRPGC